MKIINKILKVIALGSMGLFGIAIIISAFYFMFQQR